MLCRSPSISADHRRGGRRVCRCRDDRWSERFYPRVAEVLPPLEGGDAAVRTRGGRTRSPAGVEPKARRVCPEETDATRDRDPAEHPSRVRLRPGRGAKQRFDDQDEYLDLDRWQCAPSAADHFTLPEGTRTPTGERVPGSTGMAGRVGGG